MKSIMLAAFVLVTTIFAPAQALAQTATAAKPPVQSAPAKAEKPVGAGILADQIRQGDVDVGKDYTMALGGRFHRIHTKYMALKCATCHEGVKFPENIQFLRREEFPLAAYPGAVDRGTCMGCHRGEGSLATRIYGVSPK
ncbi:MAG TPA: hypothetical protein VGE12_12540 [Noviherbaspirillum sp.]